MQKRKIGKTETAIESRTRAGFGALRVATVSFRRLLRNDQRHNRREYVAQGGPAATLIPLKH